MEAMLELGPDTDLNLCDRCYSYDENLTPTSDGWICRGCVRLIFGENESRDEEFTDYDDALV